MALALSATVFVTIRYDSLRFSNFVTIPNPCDRRYALDDSTVCGLQL